MSTLITKKNARELVRSAAAAAEKGEITNSQFRGIVAYGMMGEIRSSLQQKSMAYGKKTAAYNKKYMQPSSKRK